MKNVFKFLKPGVLLRRFISIKGLYFRLAPWMITCREFNESIYDYVEGELSSPQLTAFDRHKHSCPICRNFLHTYIATLKAAKHVTPYSDLIIDDGVPKDLVKAIRGVAHQQDNKPKDG